MAQDSEAAFPQLTDTELRMVKPLAKACDYADGETIFRVGQADIDLLIVESGEIEIHNPTDGNQVIVVHEPGQFSGDIDLLTGRPVIVTAVARGQTRVLAIPGSQLRALLNRVPSFGEKLIVAFTRRRELLRRLGTLGLRVVGPGAAAIRTPSASFSTRTSSRSPGSTRKPKRAKTCSTLGSPRKTPVIECGDGRILVNPSLQELAQRPASGSIARRRRSISRSSAPDRRASPRPSMRRPKDCRP